MVYVDSKVAGLPRILRAGPLHPLTMAALLLVGCPRPGHKRIGAPSNNGSPARPMYCDCASGKCPTLIASLRVCGGKNLSLGLGPVHK
jgi:hypothetical protein